MARESKFTIDELYTKTRSLLIHHGYDGFHFGLLAERLGVTRSALYKYYRNKDELITEFMLYEMERFLRELKQIDQYETFEGQLDYLLELIFKYRKIHQILLTIFRIPPSTHEKVQENINILEEKHLDMYSHLKRFIHLGRKEKKLKPHFPDEMILGFIFQTVNIPKQPDLSSEKWRDMLKEFLLRGMEET